MGQGRVPEEAAETGQIEQLGCQRGAEQSADNGNEKWREVDSHKLELGWNLGVHIINEREGSIDLTLVDQYQTLRDLYVTPRWYGAAEL